jgi:hypothetical protein
VSARRYDSRIMAFRADDPSAFFPYFDMFFLITFHFMGNYFFLPEKNPNFSKGTSRDSIQ